MNDRYRGRFAPSPTGPLHFGSLVSACASFLDARAAGGRWLLRIDDLDQARARATAADDILHTLEGFGLHWDETPVWQSRRGARYHQALEQLRQHGLIYACDCSRSRIRAAGLRGIEGPRYDGRCRTRGLALDIPGTAIRVRVPDETITVTDRIQGCSDQRLSCDIGDFVVRRADGYFAYQLAVVIDDHDQGINQVVRGADLFLSTPRQVWLQRQLGLPTPVYAHVPLVYDHEGRKLSKSDAAHPIDPKHPIPALLAALDFLAQKPPPERPTDLAELWRWAIDNWNIDALAKAHRL